MQSKLLGGPGHKYAICAICIQILDSSSVPSTFYAVCNPQKKECLALETLSTIAFAQGHALICIYSSFHVEFPWMESIRKLDEMVVKNVL